MKKKLRKKKHIQSTDWAHDGKLLSIRSFHQGEREYFTKVIKYEARKPGEAVEWRTATVHNIINCPRNIQTWQAVCEALKNDK